MNNGVYITWDLTVEEEKYYINSYVIWSEYWKSLINIVAVGSAISHTHARNDSLLSLGFHLNLSPDEWLLLILTDHHYSFV